MAAGGFSSLIACGLPEPLTWANWPSLWVCVCFCQVVGCELIVELVGSVLHRRGWTSRRPHNLYGRMGTCAFAFFALLGNALVLFLACAPFVSWPDRAASPGTDVCEDHLVGWNMGQHVPQKVKDMTCIFIAGSASSVILVLVLNLVVERRTEVYEPLATSMEPSEGTPKRRLENTPSTAVGGESVASSASESLV